MDHLHSLKDINTVFSDTQARLLREGMQCIFFQWRIMKIMLKSTYTHKQNIPINFSNSISMSLTLLQTYIIRR